MSQAADGVELSSGTEFERLSPACSLPRRLSYSIVRCMTKARHLLSVRLDSALAEALDRHCEEAGLTRSHVVQQSVAQYLVVQTGPTLGSLAESILPAVPKRASTAQRPSRQRRFREYVREKRRR